jgi:hypothetical protein
MNCGVVWVTERSLCTALFTGIGDYGKAGGKSLTQCPAGSNDQAPASILARTRPSTGTISNARPPKYRRGPLLSARGLGFYIGFVFLGLGSTVFAYLLFFYEVPLGLWFLVKGVQVGTVAGVPAAG